MPRTPPVKEIKKNETWELKVKEVTKENIEKKVAAIKKALKGETDIVEIRTCDTGSFKLVIKADKAPARTAIKDALEKAGFTLKDYQQL